MLLSNRPPTVQPPEVYLLRCWHDGNSTRFRLENPHTAEFELFASLPELVAFLERTYGESKASSPSGDSSNDP